MNWIADDESIHDADLIALCRSGRVDAFRPLVERHGGRVHAYCLGHLANPDAAAEATQETFVRAFEKLETLNDPDKFDGWLFGIARIVVLETFRSLRSGFESLPDVLASSEDVVIDGALDVELQRAVRWLPNDLKQVVLLHYYANRSCREIAGELDVAVGTITSRLSRAYAALRATLKRNQLPPEQTLTPSRDQSLNPDGAAS